MLVFFYFWGIGAFPGMQPRLFYGYHSSIFIYKAKMMQLKKLCLLRIAKMSAGEVFGRPLKKQPEKELFNMFPMRSMGDLIGTSGVVLDCSTEF